MTDTLSTSIKFDSWDELLDKVAKRTEVAAPAKLTLPAKLGTKEAAAISHLPEQFGSVQPDTLRALTPSEIDSLLAERRTVDTVAKLVTRRKTDIAAIVKAHHNATLDAQGESGPTAKDGTYAVPARYAGEDDEQVFSVEPRSGGVNVDLDALLIDADDPEVADLSHDDYLALTRPVRVLDPDKAAKLVRERPELLGVLSRYAVKGEPVVSVYARKR